MNGEERKILISSIVLVVTLILVVVGTTYAFFSLQIEGENTTTNVELIAGEQNEITLSGGITNYHINLDVSDMTEDKKGTSYYGTTDSNKKYEKEWVSALQDIGTFTKKGTLTEEYGCYVDINIDLGGNMAGLLRDNELFLYVQQREGIGMNHDLSEDTGKQEFEFNLSNSNMEPIQAYLVFYNTYNDQSYLAGKELTVSIKIDNFRCINTPHVFPE